MPVPASINDLSTTAGANSPAGSEGPQEGDNYIRSLSSFVAILRDKLNGTSATGEINDATFSGTMSGAASWAGLQTFQAGIAATDGTFSGDLSVGDDMTVGGDLTVIGNIVGSGLAGTYTPTLTAVSNVSATTSYPCQYIHVGSVVTVSGQLRADPTTNGLPVFVGISLPVASNFAELYQCSGAAHGFNGSSVGRSGGIDADVTNNRAQLEWVEVSGAADNLWTFTFTYVVI